MAKLLMFHGQECPHCRKMMPRVERLEAETGLRVDRREVWHDEANQDLMRGYKDALKPKCGGQLRVPAFLNAETHDAFCGEVEYETLKDWALRQ
ncbi:MAG TPA: thioredoxin family protein [Candidatus Aminicenantes bacterium]|nr:thioredoxin family protein [Candidatus Aminicenantes bacterium]